MTINNISFQAKFVKNDAIMNISANEIANGRADELASALNSLSKHHSNTVLEVSKDKNGYSVKNLYNNNICNLKTFTSKEIKKLGDVSSNEYKQLFNGNNLPTPSKVKKMTNLIANNYFTNHIPDYTLGRKLDESF